MSSVRITPGVTKLYNYAMLVTAQHTPAVPTSLERRARIECIARVRRQDGAPERPDQQQVHTGHNANQTIDVAPLW